MTNKPRLYKAEEVFFSFQSVDLSNSSNVILSNFCIFYKITRHNIDKKW